ncbi:MAG: long-chain fatty acid--CoA ligase [Pseudomonadota bacterium]
MLRNVGQFLSERARLSPHLEAVVDLEQEVRLDYHALNARANSAANGLLEAGVRPGDRVAILMSNRFEYIEAFYGAAKIGAITVFLNWRLAAAELEYIVDDCSASTLVYSADLAPLADALKPMAPSITRWISLGDASDLPYETLLNASPEEPSLRAEGDAPVFLMYTSGTTGKPKGAVISHEGSIAWHHAMLATSDTRYGDRIYTVAPLFHIAGMGIIMSGIYSGGTNVLDATFDPVRAWQILEQEKISGALFVPAMLNFMAKVPGAGQGDVSTLRSILCGAAPVPVELIKFFAGLGIDIHQIYGATETHGGICLMSPEHALTKAGSTGKAYYGMEVRVVDDAGKDVAPGVPGEVITRGPHIITEYWNKPDATAKAFKDGWFYLGDIAEVDMDGFIYIKDRSKDMIISGGENIYPAEIEDVVLGHDAVKEVAVIGQPSAKWGESPVAIVVPKHMNDDLKILEEDIIALTGNKLARFKQPKAIEFIDEIPRNPSGKALKRVLRDRFPGPAPE